MLTAQASHRQMVAIASVSIFSILTIALGTAFREFVVIGQNLFTRLDSHRP
jgi:hypothetical protein